MNEHRPELSVVLGWEQGCPLPINWLASLQATLGDLAGRTTIVVASAKAACGANAHIAEWVQIARVSHAALARVAAERTTCPFILALLPSAGELPPPETIRALWLNREQADVLIAARPPSIVSRALQRMLSLPTGDMFGPCRLYRRTALLDVIGHLSSRSAAADDLELLARLAAEGYAVCDVRDESGHSRSHVPWSAWAQADRLASLWRFRNSILSADYDARAYDSVIPLQRYWQRQRFRHITESIAGEGPVLDVGCGSSRILSALPKGSLAVDILLRKLRYARRFSVALAQASGFHLLPVADNAFPCVLCSQVIEHVPKSSPILAELCRVLRPGGRLVLGTPDYGNWEWRATEWLYARLAPGGYADEHIAHYTRQELLDYFESRGFAHEATRYILRGELIMAFRKQSGQT